MSNDSNIEAVIEENESDSDDIQDESYQEHIEAVMREINSSDSPNQQQHNHTRTGQAESLLDTVLNGRSNMNDYLSQFVNDSAGSAFDFQQKKLFSDVAMGFFNKICVDDNASMAYYKEKLQLARELASDLLYNE